MFFNVADICLMSLQLKMAIDMGVRVTDVLVTKGVTSDLMYL